MIGGGGVQAQKAVLADDPAIRVTALDEREYVILANFGSSPKTVPLPAATDLVSGEASAEGTEAEVDPGTIRVWRMPVG